MSFAGYLKTWASNMSYSIHIYTYKNNGKVEQWNGKTHSHGPLVCIHFHCIDKSEVFGRMTVTDLLGLRCSSVSTFPPVGFCFLSASALPALLIPARQTERFNCCLWAGWVWRMTSWHGIWFNILLSWRCCPDERAESINVLSAPTGPKTDEIQA